MGGLAVAGLMVWQVVFSLPDDRLHLIFCDVGQGDAILAVKREVQILVDTGPDGKVAGCLARHIPFYDRQIEAVILTHPESDHIGGLNNVLESYNLKQIVIGESDNPGWQEIKEIAKEYGVGIKPGNPGDKIVAGELEFRVRESGSGDTNEESLAGELVFGRFNAYLTGDAEAKVLGWAGEAEVFKVPHHGSRDAITAELLERIKPKVAVISVGKNSFGHPTSEVLDLLKTGNIKTLRTDEVKDVEVVTDGVRWWLR